MVFVDYGDVYVFCFDLFVVYGVGICIDVCDVVCVIECCLLLKSGCCLLCCHEVLWGCGKL